MYQIRFLIVQIAFEIICAIFAEQYQIASWSTSR